MVHIDRHPKILLAVAPVDFRKSFEGLCGVIRNILECNPLDTTLYVFYNRRRDRIKILVWDSDGFWLHYKRLEQGTFELPQRAIGQSSVEVNRSEFELLLNGVILKSVRWKKRYKRE